MMHSNIQELESALDALERKQFLPDSVAEEARRAEAAEWAEEVKAEARDCGCWERILRRRGEGEK